MSISESERLLIIQKREELRVISQEILDLVNRESLSQQNINDIKKRFLQIISLLNIISTSTKSTFDIQALLTKMGHTIYGLESQNLRENAIINTESICFAVNGLPFFYSRWPAFLKAEIPFVEFEIDQK